MNKRYTEEFLLKRYRDGKAMGTPISEIARSLGMLPNTFSGKINRAKKKVRATGCL